MARILAICSKMFDLFFIRDLSIFRRLIAHITDPDEALLILGAVFLIIGFSIGIIKRIINS